MAYFDNQYLSQDAFPVEVVDTMGAGDALIAAFLVSYLDGKKSGKAGEAALIAECLRKAARFAAAACLVEGAFGYGKSYG